MKLHTTGNLCVRIGRPGRMVLLTFLIVVMFGDLVLAQDNANQPEKSVDAATIAEFLDVVVPEQLEQWHVPGATIAVVKDGQVLAARGYGWASLDDQVPVDSDQTDRVPV